MFKAIVTLGCFAVGLYVAFWGIFLLGWVLYCLFLLCLQRFLKP